jgi:hypothetical protein
MFYIVAQRTHSFIKVLETVICPREMFLDTNNCLPGVRISQQIRHTCAQEGTSAGR